MVYIKPCVVFSSGVAATGKTTVLEELVKKIENSVYLNRDDINEANLHILKSAGNISDFQNYVKLDEIFPDNVMDVITPFGEMYQINPLTNSIFYRRHIRDQSYLIQMFLAKTNLKLGKVTFIDCIVVRQIRDGTLVKLINHQIFNNYPTYVIHFIAEEEELRKRILDRSKNNDYSSRRLEVSMAQTKESFHKFITEEQPILPTELNNYAHLVIDTSRYSISECVEKCLKYISS